MDASLRQELLADLAQLQPQWGALIDRWQQQPRDEHTLLKLTRSAEELQTLATLANENALNAVAARAQNLLEQAQAGNHDETEKLRATLLATSTELTRSRTDSAAPAAQPPKTASKAATLNDTSATDPELIDIFVEESSELLEAAEQCLSAWSSGDSDAAAELKRHLHTLKGSARAVGLMAFGAQVHDSESRLDDPGQPEASQQKQLRQALDQLQSAREELFENATPTSPAATETTSPAAVSNELTALFREEAQELLEACESSWRNWCEGDTDAPGELQRHLHTLKGGARAVGFMDFGLLVHNIESELTESKLPTKPLQTLLRKHLDALQGASASLSESDPAVSASKPTLQAEPKTAQRSGARDVIRVAADNLEGMRLRASELGAQRALAEQLTGQLGALDGRMSDVLSTLDAQVADLEYQLDQLLMRRSNDRQNAAISISRREVDRLTQLQLLTGNIKEGIYQISLSQQQHGSLLRDSRAALGRQALASYELQEDLNNTRLVPFDSQRSRLERVVRQACEGSGKQAELHIDAAEMEIDRMLLERILGPLEHLLRNAIAHGIESSEERRSAGKAPAGQVRIHLEQGAGKLLLHLTDDGQGLNFARIREIAVERGLLTADAKIDNQELGYMIFRPGFSTAAKVSQLAGRGVGMDVVDSEVRHLGGSIMLSSQPQKGTKFLLRLPMGLSSSRAMLVSANDALCAVPLAVLAGVTRLKDDELADAYVSRSMLWQGQRHEVRHLGEWLGLGEASLPGPGRHLPILLLQDAGRRLALVADTVLETGEYAIKPLPAIMAGNPGLAGAAVLGDGRIVLFLDPLELEARGAMAPRKALPEQPKVRRKEGALVLVVDDSATLRRITERSLIRHGFAVRSAADGQAALTQIERTRPAAVVLDIEMPRMDGFEVLKRLRADPRYKTLPIIMFSSLSDVRHRRQAERMGASAYLIKPASENALLATVREFVDAA